MDNTEAGALLSHWPLWFVLMTAVAGALVFRQVIGKANVVSFTRRRDRLPKG